MSISDTDKTDILWKKLIFGVSTTADGTLKTGAGEAIASPLPVYNAQIWAQTSSSQIPPVPPTSTTATVSVRTGAQRIRCTTDATSPTNVTWLATTTFGDVATRVGDWVPPTFGTGYAVRVWIGDPNSGNAARIFPDTTGEPWVFDYNAGVLHFPVAVPTAKTATQGPGAGSASLTVAANGIFIEGFRYVGIKGLAVPGLDATKTYVVANITARDALTNINAGDTAHVLDASAIPQDAGSGEWANYLWNGTAWILTGTQDAARTDAGTFQETVATTPLPASVLIRRVGDGARVVSVTAEVVTPFDGDADMTVGDAGNNARLMLAEQVDLRTAGTYVSTPAYRFPTNAETEVYAYFTTGVTPPTVGQVRITITYA